MSIHEVAEKWRLVAGLYGLRLKKNPSRAELRAVAAEAGTRVWEARGRFAPIREAWPWGKGEYDSTGNRWAFGLGTAWRDREVSGRRLAKAERTELAAFEASGRGV